MVIDGSRVLKGSLSLVKFEGERIRLPDHIVERAGHQRLSGKNPVDCWFLVVKPGRFRMVLKTGTPEGDVSRILNQIEETSAPGGTLDYTENDALDGIQARLISCIVSPPPPGWRVNFPKEAKGLVPENEERSSAYVMIVAGFIEIWFPDTLRRALSGPIAEILSL